MWTEGKYINSALFRYVSEVNEVLCSSENYIYREKIKKHVITL